MDYRQGQRLTVPLDAWIYHNDKLLAHVPTRNVSRHGLFFGLHHPELRSNAIIDIELIDRIGQACWYSRAMVVHTSSSGTGVFLEEKLPYTFRRPPGWVLETLSA